MGLFNLFSKKTLSKTVKNGYKELFTLISDGRIDKNLLAFVDQLKNYDNDEEYYTTLNYVMEYLENEECFLINRLDIKSGVEELEWVLTEYFQKQLDLKITLPSSSQFPDWFAVGSEEGKPLEVYDSELARYGFKMCFFDTESDEYVFVVCKIGDLQKIKKCIKDIGYASFEV